MKIIGKIIIETVWGGVTQSILPHLNNLKNTLTHQNNAIEVSAIRRIIGKNREKARKKPNKN